MLEALQHWLDVMIAAIGTFIAAAVGSAMRYTHKVQRGEQVDWGRVWLDAPMIIFAGWCGGAAHEYAGFPETVSYIVAALTCYLGEKGVSIIVDFIRSKADKE